MKNKSYFNPVDLKVDFPSQERELLADWEKSGLVKKYLQKNNNSKSKFSFLDGPITANNPMGVHHAWGRTYKDLWQRYKNMRGFKQRFQNGFDSQGLWVEVEVEKELGFKSKKDIEKFGVEKFVQLCRDRVEKYSKIQTEQSKRLAYFMDWDHSYYTLSDDNNYLIWHFLKVCHDNGWLYKGRESVPWCPRCETAISQHEILTEDYRELIHKSVILKLPITGRVGEYLLVWTTTPWTIPANIAVAVDSSLEYVMVQAEGGKYWLAKGALKRIIGKEENILETVKGEELIGWEYKGPFDDLPAVNKVSGEVLFHRVIATDDRLMPISSEEGTGLVHTAVSAGAEDFKLGKKLGLPMIPVIADDASYLEELGFLSGKNAKDNPELIIDYLESEGWLYSSFNYKHRYPVCWRCKEELVWKVTDEWYIAMDKVSKISKNKKTLRERMIDVAKSINWLPEFGLKRELDWLSNMEDWLISKKNRFWGLALPIWECSSCGNFEVVGSYQELKEKAQTGWEKFEGKSPHKPQIDEIKLKCSKCGEIISRIEPVGNPWLDAGIVSFSTVSEGNRAANFTPSKEKPLYLSDRKKWSEWIPADYITESFPGQFKNWFYSLIAMSTVLEDTKPFDTVLGFATLLSEDGRPMHKSWGNMIEFNEGAEKIGVDVMRWMYCRQNPAENLLFGYRVADEVRRTYYLKLWNIYNFFVSNAIEDGWKPSGKEINLKGKFQFVIDSWIIARLKQVTEEVTNSLEGYNAFSSSMLLEEFVDDLSNWYIRRSRDRVGPNSLGDETSKKEFYEVCFFVLVGLSKVLSPFLPFISEIIYRNLTKEQSVHLSDWPDYEKVADEELHLIKNMTQIREIVEAVHSQRKLSNTPVRQPLGSVEVTYKNHDFDKGLERLLLEEVNIKKVLWKKGTLPKVKLDLKITEELEEEAKTRELVRNIQDLRKSKNLSLNQKIKLVSPWIPRNISQLEFLKRKTLAMEISSGKILDIKTLK